MSITKMQKTALTGCFLCGIIDSAVEYEITLSLQVDMVHIRVHSNGALSV